MMIENNAQSEKSGQVAVARCESGGSCINENKTKEKATEAPRESAVQSARENARYAAARRSAEREYKARLLRLREECEREIERRVALSKAQEEQKKSDSANIGESESAVLAAGKDAAVSSDVLLYAENGEGKDGTDITSVAEVAAEGARVREIGERLSDERARIALDREIEKVQGHFPEIKNTLDIVRLERYSDIKRMVERGYALSDAMRLVYEDVLIRRRADAAVREARGTPSSAHIRATLPTAAASEQVSEAQIRTYLSSVPGATREGAIRAYQKYKIGKK